MKKKTGMYRLLGAGAILIVLLNTWIAVRALNRLFDAQKWQAHTLRVLTETEGLVAQVRTAESAARGYILTGSKPFEDQYRGAMTTLGSRIDAIERLTSDNVGQQKRIGVLRTRVAAKTGKLDAGIEVRRGHPSGALDAELLGPVVSDTPDRIESVQYTITQIENEENRLLEERTADTSSAKIWVWATILLSSALAILLIVAAFELLSRVYRDRIHIEASAEQISTLNAELTGLNADLEKRVELRTRELAVSNQELEAFSYSVSHDLRAPLRTIDGFSLALQEDFSDLLNDEGRDYIGRVRGGVQRMGALIDALLQLSRVTRSDLQRERVDLGQMAKLVFDELRAADPEREIEFVWQPGEPAMADTRLMRIAMENLVGNAWKYTSRTSKPRIEFGSDARDGRTVYFIRDNGAGFDMQYVDRLFTAFQRLHGDRDFKGSGIGLATVSRIIRRHHGTIWAEGEPDKGATFYFTLEA